MTPTWAVVLVGLGSAVIGSLFTTLATISHERAAELRTRMLNAADEFSTEANTAIQQMYVASLEIRKAPLDQGYSQEIRTHLDKVSEAVDDTAAKQARINLLFGYDSPAGEAASNAVTWLRSTKLSLSAPEQMDGFDNGHRNSFGYYMRFNELALEGDRAVVSVVASISRSTTAAKESRRTNHAYRHCAYQGVTTGLSRAV